jgi:hypothetical protein
MVLAGARIMLAGTGKTVFVVGLVLLQPVKAAMKLTAIKMRTDRTIIRKKEDDLPIDPPRPVISARRACLDSFWKAPSVEATNFFSKLRRFAGVRARRRNPERSEGSGVLIRSLSLHTTNPNPSISIVRIYIVIVLRRIPPRSI